MKEDSQHRHQDPPTHTHVHRHTHPTHANRQHTHTQAGGVNADTCPGMWLQEDWMTHTPPLTCYKPHPATPTARTSCPASQDAPIS